MWYIICAIVGYVIGILVTIWGYRSYIDLHDAIGIKFYYRPDSELVEKIELFYSEESLQDEGLKDCRTFFDTKR